MSLYHLLNADEENNIDFPKIRQMGDYLFMYTYEVIFGRFFCYKINLNVSTDEHKEMMKKITQDEDCKALMTKQDWISHTNR